MEKNRLIRLLCTALVAAVLALALILVVAVCGGMTSADTPEETTHRSLLDLLSDTPVLPGELPDTLDWGDLTGDPDVTYEPPEPPTDGDDPTYDTETAPADPPEDTLEPWDGGPEWPTLPPSLETDPDHEWPTIPDDWETLPEEWETLPEEWDAEISDEKEIADELVGMSGDLGLPQGALGAGIASQLTVMDIYAERSDTLYLKMQSFGDYTGQGWSEAQAYGALLMNRYPADYLPHYSMNCVEKNSGSRLLFTPVMPVRVLPYYPTTTGFDVALKSDVVVMGSTDQSYAVHYRPYGEADSNSLTWAYRVYFQQYAAYVRSAYLTVDTESLAYLQYIIETEGFSADDPDIIQKVADYIKGAAVYDLAYNRNLDLEPNVALAFLGGYKEGVCRHFATAATLLYRALGIPARYTVGFLADVTAGEITAVKGMDAHAWVEVYEDGFGWRYVEVTGSPATEDPPSTGDDTTPGTGDDTDIPTEPPADTTDEPATWGDILAGVNGGFEIPSSVPPASLNTVIFHVSANESVRHLLKLKSFGNYTGQGWMNAEAYPELIEDTYSAAYLGGMAIAGMGAEELHMEINSPTGTFGVPYYVAPATAGPVMQVGDIRITGHSGIKYDVYYYPYANASVDASLAQYEAMLRDYVYENYTYVDDETYKYLADLADAQAWSRDDPQLVQRIAAYTKQAAYCHEDHDKSLNDEKNVVVAFLDEYRAGTSRHFAAAATLLYRVMGIPARYTVGYAVDASADVTVSVKGSDAYAWVEVYVDGFGWMAVDVMPAEDYRPTVILRPVTVQKKLDGTTLYASNELTGFEDFLEQGYTYEATVTGSRSERGVTESVIESVALYDPSGNNVTDRFHIRLDTGTIFVYTAELTFSAGDYAKVYDGKPLILDEEAIQLIYADTYNGKLTNRYSYRVIPVGDLTNVGTGVAAYDIQILYEQYSGTVVDHTEYFLIHRIYGTYTITPATLTLKAADAEKAYDGTPLTADSMEITGGALAEGDYIAEYTVEGSRTRVGRSDNVITSVIIRNADGEDVTRNYAIETVVGTLRVTNS